MAKKSKAKIELSNTDKSELQQINLIQNTSNSKLLIGLYLILFATAFSFYFNSIFNEYALDDAMLITQNEFTLKGFDGIQDHLTHDFIYGFRHKEADDAASSHWRPLSLITASIEIGLWGQGHPHRSHLFNVLLFVVIVLLLFYFFNQLLGINIWIAFFTVFVFAIHPIHTEVVANIKGRDELLAIAFVLLALIFLWQFIQSKKIIFYPISVLLFFIALTAKEAPIVFCAGIPVLLYFFTETKKSKIVILTLGYVLACGVLFFIKNIYAPFENVEVSKELMNNPFLLATGFLEPLCTKLYVMLLYLQKLIYPYSLAFDYSYKQIEYKTVNDLMVYVSILVYALIALVGLWQFKRKTMLSFAIIMFFITISISSNLVVDIGMVMGERLMFVPSIFFIMMGVIISKMGIDYLNEKFKINKWILAVLIIVPVFSASAYITINRNKEWKDDITLNIADFKKCPNSARIANGAGTSFIQLSAQKNVNKSTKDSLLKQAIICFNQSLKIHPTFDDAFLNRGVAYSRIDSLSKAEADWDMVRQHANHPKFVEFNRFLALEYLKYGLACGNRRSLDSSINYLEKAAKYANANDSITLECFYNLGGAYYTANKFMEAKIAFTKVMNLNPNFKDTKLGLSASEFALNKK